MNFFKHFVVDRFVYQNLFFKVILQRAALIDFLDPLDLFVLGSFLAEFNHFEPFLERFLYVVFPFFIDLCFRLYLICLQFSLIHHSNNMLLIQRVMNRHMLLVTKLGLLHGLLRLEGCLMNLLCLHLFTSFQLMLQSLEVLSSFQGREVVRRLYLLILLFFLSHVVLKRLELFLFNLLLFLFIKLESLLDTFDVLFKCIISLLVDFH